jgi:hypothetical protein
MHPDTASGRYALTPHPSSDSAAVRELTVAIARPAHDRLALDYRLTADLESLRLPEPRQAVRADGLWRHSCFEVFIARAASADYWEYNLSPSGAWAAYHFTACREGMAPLLKGAAPVITCHIDSGALQLSALLDLSWLVRASAGAGLRLGVSAVVEDRAQVLSYWALKHPAEKPDFHHADSFVVEL